MQAMLNHSVSSIHGCTYLSSSSSSNYIHEGDRLHSILLRFESKGKKTGPLEGDSLRVIEGAMLYTSFLVVEGVSSRKTVAIFG